MSLFVMNPTGNKARSRRPASLACLVGCIFGAALFAAGVAWTVLGAARTVYTPEQADEYEAAATALHAATSGHSGTRPAAGSRPEQMDAETAVAAARKRFDAAEADLKSAKFAQNELGKWLMGVGLAATVAFGIGYVASRGDQ